MKIRKEVKISVIESGDVILTLSGRKPIRVKREAADYFLTHINRKHNENFNKDARFKYFEKILRDRGYLEDSYKEDEVNRRIFPITDLFSFKISPPIFKGSGKRFAFVSLCISIVIFFASLFLIGGESHQSDVNYAIVYFIVILYISIHEIGHIIFASLMGIKAEKLGFGLFLFLFPTAFVKINEIYHLNREQAMLVNFGGIALGNYVLFIVSLLNKYFPSDSLNIACKYMVTIIVFNLLPLIKGSDGYLIFISIIRKSSHKETYVMIAKCFSILLIIKFIYENIIIRNWRFL